jgi:phosphate transport system substrate-binding protein
MILKKFRTMWFLFISAFLFASIGIGLESCGKKSSHEEAGREDLTGTVRISGAWALYPMMVKWGEEFMKVHPGVRIDVSAGGAGKGMADTLSGLVDMGMISREIREEEISQGAVFIPVVKDAVFPIVNAANPVLNSGLLKRGMRRQEFVALWLEGKSILWGDIVGVRCSEKIQVYTRSDSCGAAETWAKYLGGAQEDLKGIAVYGDPGVADAVKRDKNGIGYNNLNYAYDAETGLPVDGIIVVPIDINENGRVDPEEELSTKEKAIHVVQSGVYPSPPSRELYVVVCREFRGVKKDFAKWILTEGQNYVEGSGYIKLSQSRINEALKMLGF